MSNINYKVLFTILIFVLSISNSYSEKLLRPPKNVLSIRSDIGTVFTDVGTVEVDVLGVYANNKFNIYYGVDLNYFQSYNSHSRSYPSIQALIDSLNNAVNNIQERQESFEEFVLEINDCDENKKDGSVKTIISEEWGEELVKVEFYEDLEFSMDINQTIYFIKLLEEAQKTVKWISPQLDAFNKTEPNLTE